MLLSRPLLASAAAAALTIGMLVGPIRGQPERSSDGVARASFQVAPASSGQQVVTTAHYRIEWQGTKAEAEEAGRILEAAWPLYKAYFEAEPKLAKDEKLRVVFCADKDGMHAAFRKDNANFEPGAGGMYWPPNKTSYLHRQPTVWFTRALMLHEVAHQFHALIPRNTRSLNSFWYVEGIAEHLCRHSWDGKTLRLGITPMLSLENYHGKALALINEEGYDLAKTISGERAASREEAMASFAWLAGGGKDIEARSRKFRDKADRGTAMTTAFKSTMGDVRKLQEQFLAWLRANQEPMVQIWNQWDNLGPSAVRGIAPGVWSGCRVAGKSDWIEATVSGAEGKEWQAGLLISFVDGADYTMATITSTGKLYVDRAKDGGWVSLGTTDEPGEPKVPTKRRMRAERKDDKVIWTVDGKVVGTYELPKGHFGLGLRSCTADFEDVKFEGFPAKTTEKPDAKRKAK